MALWVVRAGRHGENEAYALENSLITVGWDELGDLASVKSREQVQLLINETYPEVKPTTTRIWTGEMWAVKERIQIDDLVAIPLKSRSAIAVARITGPYRFAPDGPSMGKHQRPVRWINTDLPRSELDQDILYAFGSSLAVFQVTRNNAEERILALVEGRRTRISTRKLEDSEEYPNDEQALADLEQFASDQIVAYIGQKFRGHELARLVAGVLTAQGYRTLPSPPGADGGIDIIAGTGPMGFDPPMLAVQVKSSDAPAEVGVLRELQGVMPRFGAQQGLVVSWGGFKQSVTKEAR
jgi:restriction system protein